MTEVQHFTRRDIVFTVSIAIVASALCTILLPRTLGLSPDSLSYLSFAKLLQHAPTQVFSGSSQFPPLYSIAVGTLARLFHLSSEDSARNINFIAIVSSGTLFYGVTRAANVGSFIALALTALFLGSNSLRTIASMAWSEAFFELFLLAVLFFAERAIRTGRLCFISLMSFSLGLALLTRYVGIALFLPAAVTCMYAGLSTRAKAKSFLGLFLAAVPLMLWRLATPHSDRREFVAHIVSGNDLILLITQLGKFYAMTEIVASAFGMGICLLACASIFSKNNDQKVIAISFLSLLVTLLIAKSFFDAEITFNERILFPLFPISLILLVMVIRRPQWQTLLVVALAIPSLVLAMTTRFESEFRKQNLFSEDRFPASELLRLSELPPQIPVYSNAADFLSYSLSRPVSSLPAKYNPATRAIDIEGIRSADELLARTRAGEAVIVIFRRVGWRQYLLSEEDILAEERPTPVVWQSEAVLVLGRQR